jgi:hypothetical protein
MWCGLLTGGCWHHWGDCCVWWWTIPSVAGVRSPPRVWPFATLKMEAPCSPKYRPAAWFYSPKDGNHHSHPCYFVFASLEFVYSKKYYCIAISIVIENIIMITQLMLLFFWCEVDHWRNSASSDEGYLSANEQGASSNSPPPFWRSSAKSLILTKDRSDHSGYLFLNIRGAPKCEMPLKWR